MWSSSHSYVDNLFFDEKSPGLVVINNKYRVNHTSKFAHIGDMWKNQGNYRFY